MTAADDARKDQESVPQELIDRERFGGSARRPDPDDGSRPPVSKAELSRGPAELAEERAPA